MSHLNIGFKFGAGDPEHLKRTSREHKEEAARVKCVISSNSCRLISAYNSLTDKHLAGYFSNTRIRRHLQRAGLITRSGRIVPDKEYRHKLIQRAHQRHVRECLAQAIFHKVLEMERLHQIEIKRKLEEFARRERVRKIKVERSKRHEEGFVHILSPRPPTGARGIWKQHSGPEGEQSESSESPNSSRPNTAPGTMQRPVRLKPIHSNSTTASVRRSSPYRLLDSSHENDVLFNCTMEKEPRRRLTPVEASHGISPYCLPVINNFVTPVPPATKRKERGLKVTRSSTVRGRRLHPTTASSGADDTPVLRSSVHQSRVSVNMVYFGKTVRLSNDLTDTRDEVKVFQQHCGGENLCVYKGKLHEGETFQFISRRHRGFPFSLTFFLNGLQVERLSSCCEFKHRKGSRLGGKHGHFGFSGVEGAAPCYKCIIAMGLDKKPTPPPKRVKEDVKGEESVSSPKNAPEMEMERTEEDAGSHSAWETSQPQDTETPVKEETAPEGDKDRDDYEEDFEADDERPAQEVKEEKSPSPPSEKERQIKEKDASETDNDEKDEDTRSHSGSSSSGSERDESDAEDAEDINEDKKAEQPGEDRRAETVAQPVENDEPNPGEAAATEDSASVARDSHVDSAGDSTEIEISDTSVPSGSDTRQSDGKDAEKMIEESKDEEEQERAKSVQEKLAEGILKEAQCSSEPELSDTSTEEEEESTRKSPQQDNQDAAPDRPVAFTEQQTKREESDTGEVVVPQKQEDSPATKEQSDDELEPHENRDSAEDEKAEEDEKAAEDEATADEDKSEERGETLHLLKEEKLARDEKTTEPLEETPAETTDAGTAEKDEDEEEKTAVEADVQCDETVQGAKSGEEDESSVSEPDEETAAVPDNAEAETMTARETKEIKAESSEEREALSREEAPVTDAEKREPADSEDGAAASESEVTVENSSRSPNGSGETTVEKVADASEGNAKDESNKDEIKEQISGKETIEDDGREEQCEPGEEGMETEEDKQKSEEDGEGEKEKQTHVTSDEIKEGENTEKNDEEEEGTDIQEETAESADNATETKEKGEETVTSLGEEEKASEGEKFEESEKAENDETSECVENKQEESEAREADEIEGEDENETERAVQQRSPEAEKSENENENKSEKSEDEESKHEEEDDKEKDLSENPVGEGTPEAAEETEKSDVGVNEIPDVTKSPEETPEFESVEQEAGRASDVDAENGEISTEGKNHEDEGEAQPKEETGEEESKSDRPAEDESTDIKELTMESEESAEKHEDDEADRAPEADEVEHGAVAGGDNVEKNDDSTPGESQPETAATEIKEELQLDDRVDNEETEEDQNGNKSDNGNENKEPDFLRKESSFEGNTDEVAVVSSGNQEQSPAPVAVDLRDTASKLDEENKESDVHPHTSENAVGVDVAAADGENGADASKASEEGASVLLKPQAQNNEADNTEQSVAAGQGNPETLGREDNTDLVTSWVNKHQSSKFFETFVEPLEDLREERADTPASNSNKEETKSTELPGSESPLKMTRMSEDDERARTDAENVPQAEEETDRKAESEQSEESAASQEMISEEHKGSKGDMGPPQECSDQKSAKEGINEETSFSKTEEESIKDTTGNPEGVSKNRPDEETADNDLTVKQPQTEEGHESTSPLGAEDISETREKADEQHREVTETGDVATSKSDGGGQEERRDEGIEGRSTGGDGKELQMIEGIKHTLSKDQLGSFSVDETLLAHGSYPLLTAATAEIGH